MIKSAYNFVPLNEEVFTPKWGPYISHDFPFEEGLSGQIVLKLEAKSPIYVRNEGRSKKENTGADQSAESTDFIQHEGRYFLPGSSIRGMLRTLVEIMAFGQLDQFNDRRFAYRDFITDSNYHKNFITNTAENQRFGWLYWRNNKLVIQDQTYKVEKKLPKGGKKRDFATVKLHQIAEIVAMLDAEEENEDLKFAYTKYQKLYPENKYPFEDSSEENPLVESEIDDTYCRILVGQKDRSDLESSVYRQKAFDSHKYEHIRVEDKAFENFKIAMGDATATENGDWTYWKRFLNQGRPIPVFFRQDKKSQRVNSFGLCKTYRLAYQYGIEEIIRARQARQQHLDFAKCLFGHTEEKGKGSTFLKGRVHIAHAWAEGQPQPMPEVRGVLGGPKASFFPYYLEQRVKADGKMNGAYDTWNTAPGKANIAGRKRYPIHAGSHPQSPDQSEKNDDVSTSFCPLPIGTNFCTTLSFHNLLPVEIGALLSALSFHGHQGCFHNIGMAKALGYGKIAVTIDPHKSKLGDQDLDQTQQRRLMGLFEAHMNAGLRGKAWGERREIIELINLARPAHLRTNVQLAYPDLVVASAGQGEGLNEFVDVIKKEKQALPRYSKLLRDPVASVTSWPTEEEPSTNDLIALVLQGLQAQLSAHLNDLNQVIESLKDLERDAQAKKAKEDETNKQAKIEKARTTIPLNVLEAKSFDKLSRLMRTWRNKIKMTDSPIPDDLQKELEEKLQALWEAEEGKPRLLGNWLNLKHGPYKKISAWIGPEKTAAFFKKNNIDPQ